MSDSERTIKDKYVDATRDPKSPGDIVGEGAKEGTNAVVRGWQRVMRYFNQGK